MGNWKHGRKGNKSGEHEELGPSIPGNRGCADPQCAGGDRDDGQNVHLKPFWQLLHAKLGEKKEPNRSYGPLSDPRTNALIRRLTFTLHLSNVGQSRSARGVMGI